MSARFIRIMKFNQRAAGVAAATAIVLLVILIVLLWTGVGHELFRHSGKHVADSVKISDGISDSEFRTTYTHGEPFTTVSDVTRPQEIRLPAQQTTKKELTAESREFVKPIKISPLGLHEDDLLYGSDQLQGGNTEPVPLRHHSGHFRHKAANIWDPHPMYEFTAFQRKFHLVLEHDSGFASPDLQVTHIWHNSSARGLPNIKSNGCFYKGYVKGDPSSSVAVSLCHGMTGHIRTSTGNYFIEPSEQSPDHAKPIEHVIYEMHGITEGKDFHHCGLIDDYEPSKIHRRHESGEIHSKHDSGMLFDYETDYHQQHSGEAEKNEADESSQKFQHKRSKRSSQEYFVEILVVADRTMARYHGAGIENYILALMYIVSGIFKDASIGNPITIALVKLEILYDRNFAHYHYPPNNGVSAADMLREFCRYQASTNTNNDDSVFHHDTALLLTRENICRNASAGKCETLGLAELGTMCDKKSSCSLVQDNGLSAAFTIAHELGHVLNMPHDDAELKCQPHITTDSISHVMSTSLKEGTDPWSWSECSRHFITEFLESRHSDCLKDPPRKDYIRENFSPDVLPGETFAGNRQCELLYGAGSHVCSYMPVCSALWCNKIDSDGCQTLHMPWGDGTPCGDGEWCQKGVCVPKNRRALQKVDGGWGSWQNFGPCSRSCGGGIKKSYRDCDSPRPQNGGTYCIGKRVRYRSCGTKECPEGSKGFREAQCSAFDNNNHNIHGVPSNVKWVPKYGLSNDDRCILYCRVYHSNLYYPLKDKVIDGTPCAPESFDICVNGQCKPAGCDHILSSGVQLDQCGKCGGRNDTCRLIQGSFNESARVQGYRTVIKIPAGSSNLDIRQYGIYGARDDNYLVLKDGVTGGRLLNNENVLTTFRKLIFYDGVTLEYSGCLKEVERINASRPLRRDLLVEVLSAGPLTPPDIRYQYTVPKSNELRYMWRYLDNEWESCDQVCNGRRKRKIICATVDTNEIVLDSYCEAIRKPSVIIEACNTNCILKWRVTGRTECSNHCGRGTRTISKECVQEIVGHRDVYPVHNSSCLHLPNPPPDIEECEGPCNSVHWKYGDWSPCSKTCGSGVQRREAYCVDALERPMSNDKCDSHERRTERNCEPQSCPTWSYGEWSSCSVSCGVGTRTRGHWCQHNNQVVDMSYCNADSMPKHEEKCLMPPCTSWEFSDWGPCSVTCGNGNRKRSVFCKTSDGAVVDDHLCHHKPKPSITELIELCRNLPCSHIEDNLISKYPYNNRGYDLTLDHRYTSKSPYDAYRWVTYEWQACSTTCGPGFQERQVICLSSLQKESKYCTGHKPITKQPCFNQPCFDVVKWVEGTWSLCSRTCGIGVRQRQVVCQSQKGTFLSDESCSHLGPKPAVEEKCFNQYCPSRKRYRWKAGPWSPCSKTCGTGEKTRHIGCILVNEETNEIRARREHYNDVYVDSSNCPRENRPKDRKDCKRKKLCPHTWITSEWGACSVPCGEGIQNRTVTCHQVNSYDWLDPIPLRSEGVCDFSDRPPLSQPCKIRDCNAQRYWIPGKWKPCSHSCGTEGRQRRDWECRDVAQNILRKRECRDIPRPRMRPRPCNLRPCGLTNCTEVQLQTNARVDGEYTMLVGGKNMSIYCKGMNTASPKEYLTLRRPDDNYSEYYDKRLKNPATCPNNGSRTDYCDCYTEFDKFGLTRFDKVRLLVETLEIHTQDFTFTKQIRGRQIGLGEAGDCYSKLQCPQGSFRINLEGTSLMISPTQQWVGRTINTALIIKPENRQKISGKCGGSCGSCGPSTTGRLKLHVLPP